jgi:hypothetical protein
MGKLIQRGVVGDAPFLVNGFCHHPVRSQMVFCQITSRQIRDTVDREIQKTKEPWQALD